MTVLEFKPRRRVPDTLREEGLVRQCHCQSQIFYLHAGGEVRCALCDCALEGVAHVESDGDAA